MSDPCRSDRGGEPDDERPRERPILFSAPMVRALLAGTKTQTRRIVPSTGTISWWGFPCDGDTTHPHPDRRCEAPRDGAHHYHDANGFNWGDLDCPYGKPGDRLWVRETFASFRDQKRAKPTDASIVVFTDGRSIERDGRITRAPEAFAPNAISWRPSIHLPRWASRILLEVTDVRVERLQSISREDALAEGVNPQSIVHPRDQYLDLWDSLNGDRAHSSTNPWVWVVSFRRVMP